MFTSNLLLESGGVRVSLSSPAVCAKLVPSGALGSSAATAAAVVLKNCSSFYLFGLLGLISLFGLIRQLDFK